MIALACAYLVVRFTQDNPVLYADLEEHFKYGSTGGECESGIPYRIWKLLPEMFPEYVRGKTYTPGTKYVSLGFLYDFCHPLATLPIKSGSLRQTESCTP